MTVMAMQPRPAGTSSHEASTSLVGLEVIMTKVIGAGHHLRDVSSGQIAIGDVLDGLRASPDLVAMVVHNRPDLAPQLREAALLRADNTIAKALHAAILEEFKRARASGRLADALFTGAFLVTGPAGKQLQDDLRLESAKWHDEEKNKVYGAMDHNPTFGALYARFMVDPSAAALQLLDIARTDPALLDTDFAQLEWMIQAHPQEAAIFVEAVNAQKGAYAEPLKTRLLRALYNATRVGVERQRVPSLAPVMGNFVRQANKAEEMRLEKLIPLLAQTVAQPEVVRSLVVLRNKSPGGRTAPALPSLDEVLEAVLLRSYSEATRDASRIAIGAGANALVEEAASSADPLIRNDDLRAAGTFLGAASNAETNVGLEESFLYRFDRGVSFMEKILPKLGDIKSTDGAGLKILHLVAEKKKPKPDWTDAVVNELLAAVYSKMHPRPSGPADDPNVRHYDAEYSEFRSEGSQAFTNAYQGEKK